MMELNDIILPVFYFCLLILNAYGLRLTYKQIKAAPDFVIDLPVKNMLLYDRKKDAYEAYFTIINIRHVSLPIYRIFISIYFKKQIKYEKEVKLFIAEPLPRRELASQQVTGLGVAFVGTYYLITVGPYEGKTIGVEIPAIKIQDVDQITVQVESPIGKKRRQSLVRRLLLFRGGENYQMNFRGAYYQKKTHNTSNNSNVCKSFPVGIRY